MIESGNALGLIVLMAWPIVAVVAFRRYPPPKACALVLLGGVLILPCFTHVRLPGLAAMNKETMPALWALIGLALVRPRRVIRHPPFRGVEALFLMVVIAAAGTAITNADALWYGGRNVRGIGLYETMHVLQYDFLGMFLPFYIARLCYRTAADLRGLMTAVVVGALLYAPLILIESRMSPQLHNWVYGISPVLDFNQAMRGGGWRPNVFFMHGLSLAVFMASALVAAAPFARYRWPLYRLRWSRTVFAAMGGLLFLCHSAGGLVYGTAGAALAWVGSSRNLLRAATMLAMLTMAYPFLRAWEMFPDETMISISEELANYDRAASLEFRFENEALLMEKFLERPTFGWGPYGRAVVYDEMTGDELSVRDGAWMIILGERGIFGFAAAFGLLLMPVFMALARLRRWPEGVARRLGSTLAFVVALNTVDLLPNGLFNYLPFFFAGALAGVNEATFTKRPAIAREGSRAREGRPRPSPRRRAPAPAT